MRRTVSGAKISGCKNLNVQKINGKLLQNMENKEYCNTVNIFTSQILCNLAIIIKTINKCLSDIRIATQNTIEIHTIGTNRIKLEVINLYNSVHVPHG